MMRIEAGGETILQSVARKHLEKVTFAPDMVKFSKAQIRKLIGKKPGEDDI